MLQHIVEKISLPVTKSKHWAECRFNLPVQDVAMCRWGDPSAWCSKLIMHCSKLLELKVFDLSLESASSLVNSGDSWGYVSSILLAFRRNLTAGCFLIGFCIVGSLQHAIMGQASHVRGAALLSALGNTITPKTTCLYTWRSLFSFR